MVFRLLVALGVAGVALSAWAEPSVAPSAPVTDPPSAAASFRMPTYPDAAPPPARTHQEVEALLAGADAGALAADLALRPLRIVLVAGPKDHQKGEHDYPAWQQVWMRLLPGAEKTEVQTAWEFPSAEQMEWADVLVFYQRGKWDDDRALAMDPFLARGGGAVYLHWAVDGRGGQEAFAERIGLASLGGSIRYRHGPQRVDFAPGAGHPIARNAGALDLVDETYWRLTGDPKRLTLLATVTEEGAPTPQWWTVERGRGRVFVCLAGHYMWTFDDPLFRTLVLRGVAWSGGRCVDRFNSLVTRDARVE